MHLSLEKEDAASYLQASHFPSRYRQFRSCCQHKTAPGRPRRSPAFPEQSAPPPRGPRSSHSDRQSAARWCEECVNKDRPARTQVLLLTPQRLCGEVVNFANALSRWPINLLPQRNYFTTSTISGDHATTQSPPFSIPRHALTCSMCSPGFPFPPHVP